ncbi:MAG: transglycosylase SLT domain-containing protein [Elusimicrobia bacterium]|nr:transglycosylase SLT domain-containing protein [Elusimicrobiota bacterium]
MKKEYIIILFFALYLGLTTGYSGADFNVYYSAAKNFIQNKNISYSSLKEFQTAEFNYAPPSLLLFLPFSYLSNEIAGITWYWLNIIFIFTGIYIVWKSNTGNKLYMLLIFLLLTIFFYPVKFGLFLGQASILIFFIYTLSLVLIQKNNDYAAGFLLSIPVLMKIFPIIFIIYGLVTKRKKIFYSMIISLVLWFIISFVVFGIQTNLNYFKHIWYLWSYTKWDTYPNWISITAFFNKIFTNNLLSHTLNYLTMILLVFISILYTWKENQFQKVFYIFILLSILLSKFSQIHWFIWTLAPMFFLINTFINEKKWGKLLFIFLIYSIINTSNTSFTICLLRNYFPDMTIVFYYLPIFGIVILWLTLIQPKVFRRILFLVCFCSILILSPQILFARKGTMLLLNGNVVTGDIVYTEDGDCVVETNKCSIVFSEDEIQSVKFAAKSIKSKVGNSFIQKMRNTKKIKEEKEKNYEYDTLIYIYADKYNLDPAFVKAVLETESNFNPNDTSYKGAVGLMQIMPETAKGLRIDPNDVEENIAGGTRYLRYLFKTFGDSKLALAGYNAGPNAVEKYGRKIPPYKETENYVRTVLQNYQKHKSDKQMWYFVDENEEINISNYPKDKRYQRIEK